MVGPWGWLGSGDTYPEEGHDPIPGDGLQEAGGSGEALQPSPTRGEERADDNDPWGRPCQGANHQVPIHSFTKPVGHQHHLWLHPMAEPHECHRGTTQPHRQVRHRETPPWGDQTGPGKGSALAGDGPQSPGGQAWEWGLRYWESVPVLASVTVAGDKGRQRTGAPHSLCREEATKAVCGWILVVLVLATQKCHLQQQRTGLPQIRLLTNEHCWQCGSGRKGCGCSAKHQGGTGMTQ